MNKNLFAFFALATAIIIGWTFLQQQLWPVKPEADKKGQVAKAKVNETKGEKKGDKEPEPKKPEAKAIEAKKDEKKDDKKEEAPIPAPDDVATFLLGDKDFYLNLVVTNRGAGVEKLTMTRFKAADYNGKPENRDLAFLQDDPHIPSFLMGVYGDPVDGTKFSHELGRVLWNVEAGGPVKNGANWSITFWTMLPEQRHIRVTKTYSLNPRDYHVGLAYTFQNSQKGTDKTNVRYQFSGGHGLPNEGEWYTPATSMRTALFGKLDPGNNLYRTQEYAASIVAIKDTNGRPKKQGAIVTGDKDNSIQYAGVITQYFASVILPDPKQPLGDWRKVANILERSWSMVESEEFKATLLNIGDETITFLKDKNVSVATLLPRTKEHLKKLELKAGSRCVVNIETDPITDKAYVQWFRLGQTPIAAFDDLGVRVVSENIPIPAEGTVTHKFLLYHGPVKTMLLGQMGKGDEVKAELVDMYTHQLHLNTLTDYPADTWISNNIFWRIGWTYLLIQCTKLMHMLLYYLHFLAFGDWGISIILLTIVVRGAMFPISRKQALMSQKMQVLAPEMKKLQEKYKGDKQAQAQATMELYRKHKVSPASGCMPLFLQMPIFMGLYYCLQESVQFRLAPFLWIDNLAAPDMLIWWGQWIPWVSDPDNLGGMLYLGPYFNLLPIFAVAFMVVQQKLMSPPAQNEEQEMQQKTMQIMMAVMGIFFYKMAAGLCLYFIASSMWGVAERKLLPKKSASAVEPVAAIAKAMPSARERRRERDREKDEPETLMTKLKAWWQKLLKSAEKK